ncbi:MAG: transposase [Oscillochloris sp.]|nr:transposase [Oscillochloris sp.]
MSHAATTAPDPQAAPRLSAALEARLVRFVQPLLVTLNQQLDVRLVRTFLATLVAIVSLRHRQHGLLLSELGAALAGGDHAPAGTKRLSNLLRAPTWAPALLHQWLWARARHELQALEDAGEQPLAVWDESVLEKPETEQQPDFCPVRSSKGRRLSRIRPGFFQPPTGRPLHVAGLHWLGVLLTSQATAPVVAAMTWWTTRGAQATNQTTVVTRMLLRCAQAWGRRVLHLFDRGFASEGWVATFLVLRLRFVLRWKKGQQLLDNWGDRRKAWEIARGKRSVDHRWLRDSHTGERRKVGIVALPVNHPSHAQPLWLVVARTGKGREPWYLLTSEVMVTVEDAWRVVLAYGRRWQIEQTWRYTKSELAFESPRVWTWERREKLLLMATLVYAFLLSAL